MRVVPILALVCIPLSAQSAGDVPKDVYPDSRSRLPVITRENLSEQGKKAYDTAAANAPNGRPDGAVAIRLHRSGADVRWESPVGRALTELAIISTAREQDQPYEWSLHEMEAIAVGLDPAVIDAVRNKKALAGVVRSAGTR